MKSTFQSHDQDKYAWLNGFDVKIPIEMWVEFYDKFGKFPENIDVGLLKEILAMEKQGEEHYATTFGSTVEYADGTPTISTCRSAAMGAILKEEMIRDGLMSPDDKYLENSITIVEYIKRKVFM
jgi:hypothetical protein